MSRRCARRNEWGGSRRRYEPGPPKSPSTHLRTSHSLTWRNGSPGICATRNGSPPDLRDAQDRTRAHRRPCEPTACSPSRGNNCRRQASSSHRSETKGCDPSSSSQPSRSSSVSSRWPATQRRVCRPRPRGRTRRQRHAAHTPLRHLRRNSRPPPLRPRPQRRGKRDPSGGRPRGTWRMSHATAIPPRSSAMG